MSDLPADSLGYQAVVAEFFLGLKGSGLLLSPLDQELVAEWERRGLPVAVVCRGIRAGMAELRERREPAQADEPGPARQRAPETERGFAAGSNLERAGAMGERRLPARGDGEPGAPPRGPARSLRAVRFAVEDEWRAYRSGRVGDSPAPPEEAVLAARRLAEARERLARAPESSGPLREAYLQAERALLAAGDPGGARLEAVEAALAAADASLLAGWLASLGPPERTALGARIRLRAGPRRPGESPRAYRKSLRAHLLDLAAQAGLTRLAGTV